MSPHGHAFAHATDCMASVAECANAWRIALSAIMDTCTTMHMLLGDSRTLQETRDIFDHGYDNYMKHAFPEDELRPLTCAPLTRDRYNPAHIEVNDVLGNYSLTLIDSLSTLAIFASTPPPSKIGANRPLAEFQDGVKLLVENYGDGRPGPSGQGARSRGFDLDSKVQVFETVIRGVGGLLSAHQFAVGDLPIRGYKPTTERKDGKEGIVWPNGFVYDGQLLHLARDLAERLLPAFNTPTGLPYPRVNLRHGVPFYAKSPHNMDAEHGQCGRDPNDKGTEVTETCSAGAGSLVLEFTVLSRLTGNPRYEQLAKKAFWAVWQRRSSIGLIGAGIDAETGQWVNAYTGIGAGIDSFFEYALKSHILLSGLPYDEANAATDSPDAFLTAWLDAHDSIKRQIYRGAQHHHPHYAQVDLYTGAIRAFWIDSLSAFYQGLLTLAGELDEAIETHLLYTALWTRYSAMPERWSTATGGIEHGLRWWGGRPEWIESTWYLYQATKDPWYLHVGEMALRDIKRRCWTKCGWAGLQDVRTGELNDRMESFFLGETVKYLFLLFDPSHPLNTWDAPFVFTTEGHPLIIPKRLRSKKSTASGLQSDGQTAETCPLPPAHLPFSISATAARPDVYHAASLAKLHLMPTIETLDSPLVEFNADHPSISMSDVRSPSNYTYYPWTLPPELIPHNATSSSMAVRSTFDLTFPNMPSTSLVGALQRVQEGILVNSISGLRFGMVREHDHVPAMDSAMEMDEQFRIYAISNIALGRDEKVFMSRATMDNFNPLDPFFTRTRDAQVLDLVIDVPPEPTSVVSSVLSDLVNDVLDGTGNLSDMEVADAIEFEVDAEALKSEPSYLSSLLSSLQALLSAPMPTSTSTASWSGNGDRQLTKRYSLAAALPTGPGAVPMPDTKDADLTYSADKALAWTKIYVHPTTLCNERLGVEIAKQYQVIVIPRGDCSFSTKLHNVPAYPPSSASLQLVVIVSFPEHEDGYSDGGRAPAQPLLDEAQHTPTGMLRPNPVALVMVGGGQATMDKLKRASGMGMRRRYHFRSQGVKIGNLIVL
ncbi:glycoside hydrolase family 47 protein [Bipolaris maydis C5]|uniref:alpha-1,2-Mannosidase n=1 Tax=Cochliobolus heterostrophus (strain C5 / ATCC 48332 / race O) TaxID=701091 RepID=M2TDS9_COCH5|nr:glycoside hydrolase family 47 protein [Bipolaris maydis C5]KAJ5030370.1 glycoside hydrolase family 47 protein [Bipolaris maydis]KAJ5065380.1 glycosyl hydrolase family 47-domain-containing protein [Bipolaris maydis]KAJ6200591.1 glycosyl hydrolase family 47-domain-containing protein [Bipolaris maydis]KAJ6213565.1 glycoside hydrolase family 47 protein [Bipolaris maydis]